MNEERRGINMKKILAVAHSYYMLLTLIQMKMKVYKNDMMDLLLSDASSNNQTIFHNLKKSGIFNSCYFYHLSDVGWKTSDRKKEKAKKFFNGILKPQNIISKAGIKTGKYDILLIYVAGRFDEQVIFNVIKKKNPKAVCELYEEGYTSYFNMYGVFASYPKMYIKILPIIMFLTGKKRFLTSNNINRAWYFNPGLVQYNADFDICKIPAFDIKDKELIYKINTIYGYSNNCDVKQDVIFLEGKSFTDGLPTDDLELLNRLCRNIGKENIVVKLHPRTRVNRFISEGYQMFEADIPLELVILNGKGTGKVFIAMESGAPLTCLMDFQNDNNVVLLFKCSKFVDGQTADRHFLKLLDMLKKKSGNGQLAIPETISELDKISKKINCKLKNNKK
jgi:hypothetical protein